MNHFFILIFLLSFNANAIDQSAPAKKTRKAETFAELQGKNLTLEGTAILQLEGQNAQAKIAFTTAKKDGCRFVMNNVADFSAFKNLSLGPESAKTVKWKVGALSESRKIKAPEGMPIKDAQAQMCKDVPILYRPQCMYKISVLGTFETPFSTTLVADDGRTMTVYSPESHWGLYNCLDHYAFQLPQIDDTAGATVQMAHEGAGAAR